MTIKAVTCKNGIYSDIFEISYIFNPTGFTLLNAVTDQNGNIVTKSNLSGVSSLSFTMYAPDFVGKSENMYICEYNHGKLVSVAKKEFTQTEETTTVNFPWTANGNEVSALKAFIWDANYAPQSDDILIFME